MNRVIPPLFANGTLIMRHAFHDLFNLTATLASLVVGLTAPALGQDRSPGPGPAQGAPIEAATLIRLPATQANLTFRGESAVSAWPIYLDEKQASQITGFQMALLNTVSVLPERSSLRVSINGTDIGEVPAASAQTASIISMPVPKGLLASGFNAVTIRTTLIHRVDCSVMATHELWATLKPAHTGFTLPAPAKASLPSIQDLAGFNLAEDGTAHIHFRSDTGPTTADLDRAGRFIAAIVKRAHLLRPIVDVGPAPGTGPGFDVIIGRTADLQSAGIKAPAELARVDNVAIGREEVKDRVVLTLSAADDAALDSALESFAARSRASEPVGAPAGLRLLEQSAGLAVRGGDRLSLTDLGLGDVNAVGRRFVGTLRVSLPEDVYPGSFARAHLYLDGTRAGDLDPAAAMTIRVNGKIASFSNIGAALPETFRRHRIDLPLNVFHPGSNEIEIEAVTPSSVDATCDTMQMRNSIRLSLSGRSVLEFPTFAHLRLTPELAGNLNVNHTARNIYLPDTTVLSLASGLTLAANVATLDAGLVQRPGEVGNTVAFHLGPPRSTDAPGVVVVTFDRLPAHLAGPLSRIAKTTFDQPIEFDDTTMTLHSNGDAPSAAAKEQTKPKKIDRLTAMYDRASGDVGSLLQSLHFYFGGVGHSPDLLPVSSETLIVAAVEPAAAPHVIAGIPFPRISSRPDQWVVLSGGSMTIVHAGIEHLLIDNTLSKLAGQAVSLDLNTNEMQFRDPVDHTYVVSGSVAFSELRPILGGFMSDNIGLSAIALLMLLTILGGSTHLFIRTLGDRDG